MAVARLPSNFRKIREVARHPCDSISLGHLLRNTRPDTPSLIRAARWLQVQLPVRFARRIEDFVQLPHVVVSNPHINNVLQTYLDTFDAVNAFGEIHTEVEMEEFRHLINAHMAKHGDGTRLVAEGYRQIRHAFPHMILDEFLHGHFTSRIATRILMENFVIMHNSQEGYIGVVRQGMKPLKVIQGLAQELTRLTQNIYGTSPEVEYRGNLDCTLDYIPRHVSYMVQEVLKNALRATVERHQARVKNFEALPPVVVELQKGDVHVIIKISDQGGGMPKRLQQEAWQYGWTTVGDDDPTDEAQPLGRSEYNLKTELAGFGFGLPLTRLHAQYFGGDVFMQALPGHGTDMYLLLTHLKEGTPSTEIDDLSTILEKGKASGLQ
eukprot:CAMPEP_0206462506 /NCGR_PEP_ID=MMETSP0324_2-20121206/26020_1 /ASSEMBLY_ACC=CAM_ASM_000836 /TAXON_ID=2866 /ORGANISM="Crypthecodinium cohnii, Strain Seligo" /LENGTH=379 /DNA_ID=CAMNT_0053934677 /DNA_START=57 /DNA_END=1196 /DNA_ORIENTATION=+